MRNVRLCTVVAALLAGALPSVAGWDSTGIEDKLTGKKMPALILNAKETTIAPNGWPSTNRDTAFLMLTCTPEDAAVMVLVPDRSLTKKGTTISYRIDQEAPALKQPWVPSKSGEGMGIFERKPALAVFDRLSKASTFFVRIQDDVFGMAEASFALDGLPELIKPMRQECRF